MADVLLLHHVQGLTPGMEAFASTLRDAGHTVHAPDLFDGRTFTTIDDGMAHAREVGFGELAGRGVAAADDLGSAPVFIGFSLGVMAAQQLAQTRADARGAVLVDACAPVSEFSDGWPEDVPVQVHGMGNDPFFAAGGDLDAARELVATTEDAELFLYDGDVHLFADASLDVHDPEAADLLVRRVLAFLDELD
ncbi:dienelactone hydrolase family protein [Nitriliruptoria bacterium AS10]|nr:dienelactone hydrolase family protein [Salsipaludibacter albus]